MTRRTFESTEAPLAPSKGLSRRSLMAGGLVLAAGTLAGCQTYEQVVGLPDQPPLPDEEFDYASAYAALPDGDFTWPAINYKAFDEKYLRQVVEYKTREKPGTIIVDTTERRLYHVLGNGKAMRFAADEVRDTGRATQGVRIMKPDAGDRIVGIDRFAVEEEEGVLDLDATNGDLGVDDAPDAPDAPPDAGH